MHYTRLWSQITGIDSEEDSGSNIMVYEKQVPLLLKDVSAILLQFLYALPFNIDKGLSLISLTFSNFFSFLAYFISITQALLNLNFIQALILITYQIQPEQRSELKSKSFTSSTPSATIPESELNIIGDIQYYQQQQHSRNNQAIQVDINNDENNFQNKFETIFDYISFIMDTLDLNANSLITTNFMTIDSIVRLIDCV